MDTIVEIRNCNTILETFIGYAVYINNKNKWMRIEQKNGYYSEYDYIDIECDNTHRHYTVYIKEK